MANVRCPMCSKFNPPDVEACSYCGARLKPVRPHSPVEPGPQSGDKPEAGPPAGGDTPDWLSGLRSDGLDDIQPSLPGDDEPASEGDVPDWLSRIRDRTRDEIEPPGAPDEPQPDDLPDWMSALSPAPPAADEEDQDLPDRGTAASSGDDLDWLSGLNLGGPAPDAQTSPEEANQPNRQSFGLTDFLRQEGERASQQQADETPDFDSQSGGEPPSFDQPTEFNFASFLSDREDSSEPPAAAPAPAQDDLSSWLTSFQPEEAQDESTPPQAPDSGVPSWLSEDLGSGEAQPAAQAPGEDDVPTWLGGDFDAAGAEPMDPQPAEPDSGVPSWLGSDFEAPQAETPASQAADSGLPAWLSGGFGEQEPAAEEAPDAMPGWFSTPEDAQPEDAGLAQQPAAPYDWMSGEPAAETPSEPEPQEPQLPDWMAGFSTPEAGLEEQPTQRRIGASDQEEPAGQPGQGGETEPFIDEETPDWLRDFSSGSAPGGDTPPALIGFDEPAVPLSESESDQPFAVELPDWLSEESPAQVEPLVEAQSEAPEEELAQAELPDWVKDMRPIEAAMTGGSLAPELDERIEKAGPLAGLRGVLPTEDQLAHYRKPPVYSVKLRVSEKQRGLAAMFENIISQETQPLLIPPVRRQAAGIIPRVLVALLLIVALLVPRVMDIDPLGIPVLYPAEMLDMFQQIDQVQQEAPVVLLAVDFEPGRAGEMQLTASPVIEHLMARGARLVLISTVPNGPALAQRMLATAARDYQQRSGQAYDLEGQAINLGYLPGGAISLLEFAQYPRRSAPADVRGDWGVWNQPLLQEIDQLQDFAQVIVLTDSAETGRSWVEQVQPLMGGAPLFMITSAQASPLLTPYLESGQISGLVSGLLGGAMYARLINQGTSAAQSYLATYQVGMLLAFGLILIGGLVSGGRQIFRRKQKDEA